MPLWVEQDAQLLSGFWVLFSRKSEEQTDSFEYLRQLSTTASGSNIWKAYLLFNKWTDYSDNYFQLQIQTFSVCNYLIVTLCQINKQTQDIIFTIFIILAHFSFKCTDYGANKKIKLGGNMAGFKLDGIFIMYKL